MIYIILILFIYSCRKHTTRQIGCKITNNITQYQKPKAILTKTVKRFGRLRVLYYICSRIWKLEIQNLLISDSPVQGNQVQNLSCSCSCEPIVKLDNKSHWNLSGKTSCFVASQNTCQDSINYSPSAHQNQSEFLAMPSG